MTFNRLIPVIKKLQIIPWLGLGFSIIALIGLIVYSVSGPPKSEAQEQVQEQNEVQLSEKLNNLKAEAKSLRERLSEESKPSRPAEVVEPQMLVGVSKSSGAIGADTGGFQKVASAKSNDIYIPMGSVFRAQLIMPIKTSVQETFVMAQTTHEYRFDNDSIRSIPAGSRVIGRAQLNPVLKGVAVRFHTLVTPKGVEYPINMIALSKELFAEVDGIYFSNDVETYGAILAFGAIGGFANASQSTDSRYFLPTPNKGVANLVWGSVGGASFRLTEELIRKIQDKNVEYVVVPSGEKIFLALQERFVIKDKKPIR